MLSTRICRVSFVVTVLASMTRFSLGHKRCHTRDPTLEDTKKATVAVDKYIHKGVESFESIEFPVHWHVLTDGLGTGNLTDERIALQLKILNNAFAGKANSEYPVNCNGKNVTSSGINSGISFVTEGVYRYANPEWFNVPPLPVFAPFKEYTRVGGANCTILNVWTTEFMGGSSLGYSSFPWDCGSEDSDISLDGVVINYRSLPRGNFVHFNQGDTLVHEVGHWLGLYHTFHNGCDRPWLDALLGPNINIGDQVTDTPSQLTGTTGCPRRRNTCPFAAGVDPIQNYMDYSDDCCMNRFSKGQVERMRAMAVEFRVTQ